MGRVSALRIESRVVVERAELLGARVVRMVLELVAQVAVEPEVMEEVVALEDAVVLHHPQVLGAHEGLQDGRRDVGMVEGAERVADVVQQRAGDVLVVAAVAQRAGRGLQRVRVAVDREAAVVALQDLQVLDHALGQGLREGHEFAGDDLPVGGGAVLHADETGAGVHVKVSWWTAILGPGLTTHCQDSDNRGRTLTLCHHRVTRLHRRVAAVAGRANPWFAALPVGERRALVASASGCGWRRARCCSGRAMKCPRTARSTGW
jgi:hypothetical protein